VLTVRHVLLLPGAGGDREFGSPLAQRLPPDWEKIALAWPGLGDQPHDPAVGGLDDLVMLAGAALTTPSDLIAQSMGGVIALRLAARYPEKVRRLVLVATSGGFDLAAHDAEDWRDEYRRTYPDAAAWITKRVPDAAPEIAAITAHTLLLWGDHDPISPISVGTTLAGALRHARIHVVVAGTHSLAHDQPDVIDHRAPALTGPERHVASTPDDTGVAHRCPNASPFPASANQG
jgi:pimeloyl-ACP methyl ester carboxylesterase